MQQFLFKSNGNSEFTVLCLKIMHLIFTVRKSTNIKRVLHACFFQPIQCIGVKSKRVYVLLGKQADWTLWHSSLDTHSL